MAECAVGEGRHIFIYNTYNNVYIYIYTHRFDTYCIVLQCTVLYYTIPYSTVLYCTVL